MVCDSQMKLTSEKSGTFVGSEMYILAILSVLMGFASLSTDLYLPALPEMSRDFGAEDGIMEFTISGYLAGFSFGQLFWGPLSDRFGRKPCIAAGLLLFILGSAACGMASSVELLIFFRIIQALGACASVALSRAMVRDLYQGTKAAQKLSTLITIMAVMPLVAPLVGGQIIFYFGWRTVFAVLVGIGVLTLLSLLTIPETLKHENRSTSSLMKSLMGYFKLAKSPKLVAYVGISSLPSAGIFAYVAATPSIYINFYGVPAHYYGLLFAICIVGMMITNLLNIRLLEKFDYNQVLLWGSVGQLVIAILVGIITYYSVGGLFALVFMLFLYISSTGFIGANAMTGALNDYGSDAGAVSAVLGAFQYGGGIAGSALVGIFADGTPVPLGMVVAGSGVVCFFFVGLLYYQLNIKKDL